MPRHEGAALTFVDNETADAEEKLMNSESTASVCYRTGRLTFTDYDEAIDDLQAARRQAIELERGGGASGCAVCSDGDHTAESCHHNPLVLARRWAAARGMWNCYHCGYIAYNDEEAKAHFGTTEDEVAKCIRQKMEPANG